MVVVNNVPRFPLLRFLRLHVRSATVFGNDAASVYDGRSYTLNSIRPVLMWVKGHAHTAAQTQGNTMLEALLI